jgi:hypothetical protein
MMVALTLTPTQITTTTTTTKHLGLSHWREMMVALEKVWEMARRKVPWRAQGLRQRLQQLGGSRGVVHDSF